MERKFWYAVLYMNYGIAFMKKLRVSVFEMYLNDKLQHFLQQKLITSRVGQAALTTPLNATPPSPTAARQYLQATTITSFVCTTVHLSSDLGIHGAKALMSA